MNAPAASAPRRRPRRWKRWLAGGVLAPALLAALGWEAVNWVPLPPALFQPPPPPLALRDAAGRPLRQLRDAAGFVGRAVTLAEVPQCLVDATVAAEDKRFWSHPGVDWRAIARAALANVRHHRVVSGASTITQQLVKLADYQPRTLRTKLVEALRALRLEREWSKQRILAEYLSRIDYGHFNRGAAAAADFYFHKPLKALTVAEAALLAGLPQAPSRHDPHRHSASALRRRTYVLQRMRANGWLTREEYTRALREPLRLASPARTFRAPHFVDFLLQRERRRPTLPGTGVVRTTLDLELQTVAEQCLRRHLAALVEHHVRQGAVVVLDNATGGVLALVGSPDYRSPDAGQVNGAWAARSAGSTLKPFTYLLAFERGRSPASVVADVPSAFPTTTGVFAPVNYDRQFHGPVRCRVALANSLNVAAVRVLDALGGPAPLLRALQACGLTTLTRPPEFYGLGLTIGNSEVRLLELVNAYACLARLGEYRPWRLTFHPPTPPARRLFRADCAWLIADVLDDDDARRLAFGLESPLRFDFPVACKTGTSSDFRDNWAVGYTPEFTVGVWVGNFDGSPMRGVSGISGAGPILHDLFVWLRERRGVSWYDRPAAIATARVHPVLGKRLPDDPAALPPAARREWERGVEECFLADQPPPLAGADDFDAQGRLKLPATYAEWLASGDNRLGNRAVARALTARLRITWPRPGTVLLLDPDLPDGGRRLRLRAEGPPGLTWHSDTLLLESAKGVQWAHLVPGRHRLEVIRPDTHERRATWIEVRPM